MAKKFDPSLYLVTDPTLTRGRSVLEIVQAAVTGGATLVQLREKEATTREFVTKVLELRKYLNDAGVPLIINDRVDVTLAARADGVHLGGEDMPYQMARELLGPDAIIGVSVESVEEAIAVSTSGPDYVAVSPVFATGTKLDHAPPLGLEGLREIRARIPERIIAIGGVTMENAADVVAAGADGIAVVTALTLAENPAAAARDLLNEIVRGREYAG
jgi:thiamine-phosphate pyrophosphorylase